MRTQIAAVLAITAMGCAGDDKPSVYELLQGTWSTTTRGCAVGFSFDDAERYEFDLVCPLADGGYGVQAEVGEYSASETRLIMTPVKSTCADATHESIDAGYSAKGDTLVIVGDTGALQLRRVSDAQKQATGADGVASFGCWDDALETLTPGKLHEI